MDTVRPNTPADLAAALHQAAASGHRIRLGGAFSKDAMAGPVVASPVCISTSALSGVIQYEPRDLTISVGAGMRWADLTALLASNGQMVPLDPPLHDRATVGGVVAANCSGPRRRLYGSARDQVIGMTFATLEGKLIQSGGMVVKNVAGLDMAKLLIGSFGTLAAIAVVNFKLTPISVHTRSFIQRFETVDDALSARDALIDSVLQPSALDLLNPAAADRVGLKGWCLLMRAGGDESVLDRYSREIPGASLPDDSEAEALWTAIREFVPAYVADNPNGAVLRYSTTLSVVRNVLHKRQEPTLCRAATGVTWVCVDDASEARPPKGAVVEWSPTARKESLELWPQPGPELVVMKKIKALFDPEGLLNPGRLYGRI